MKTNGKCNNSHAPRSCSLYIGISDLRLPVCIAIDLAHLTGIVRRVEGGGEGVNPQLSEVTWTLLHLNICKKISFDTSVKWIVEEFVDFSICLSIKQAYNTFQYRL